MSLVTDARAILSPALATLGATLRAALLAAASAVAERYCARKFLAETVEEFYDGDDTHELLLKRFPVNSIAAVYLVDSDDPETDITDETGFVSETGILYIKPSSEYSIFPLGRRNVKVSYNGGFSEIPEDVQSAVISIATMLLESESKSGAIASEKLGDWSASYIQNLSELPGSAKMLLSSYRDRP